MLAELGITLDPVKHTFIYYPNYTEPRKQARVPITLPLVNVISIDKIIINKHHIAEEEDYFFDKKIVWFIFDQDIIIADGIGHGIGIGIGILHYK